jgi:hypothetical protein
VKRTHGEPTDGFGNTAAFVVEKTGVTPSGRQIAMFLEE